MLVLFHVGDPGEDRHAFDELGGERRAQSPPASLLQPSSAFAERPREIER